MNTEKVDFPLVDIERVIELHSAVIASKGGALGLRDRGLLLSAIDNAVTAAMYSFDNGKPDALQVAARLLYNITRNHPFLDGNKRTAWLACEEQLRCIGLKVNAQTDDAESMVIAVTTGTCGVELLVEWLSVRLKAYEPSS